MCGMTAAIHHRHASGVHTWPGGVRGVCEAGSWGLTREATVEVREHVEAGEIERMRLRRGGLTDVRSSEVRSRAHGARTAQFNLQPSGHRFIVH